MKLIDKDALVAEIEKLIANGKLKCQQSQENNDQVSYIAWSEHIATCGKILSFINPLEVKDPYEQCVQYDSIKAGIQAHAETYSFNIESELFYQLTKEQQKLWRKEIEQAVISGGEAGVELARDLRYKENLEVKEVDLEKEMSEYFVEHSDEFFSDKYKLFAKHFFELGLKMQENQNLDDIKREWYNKGYLKGRKEAHIPARELGLPKVFDLKPLDADLERDAVSFCFDNGLNTTPHIAKTIAKHFFELGFQAQKGEGV